jgi:hypothetical protein
MLVVYSILEALEVRSNSTCSAAVVAFVTVKPAGNSVDSQPQLSAVEYFRGVSAGPSSLAFEREWKS